MQVDDLYKQFVRNFVLPPTDIRKMKDDGKQANRSGVNKAKGKSATPSTSEMNGKFLRISCKRLSFIFPVLEWEFGGRPCDLLRMICQGQTFYGKVCPLSTLRQKKFDLGRSS